MRRAHVPAELDQNRASFDDRRHRVVDKLSERQDSVLAEGSIWKHRQRSTRLTHCWMRWGGGRTRSSALALSIGRHHGSRTDGGARPQVGQLDYDLSSTSAAAVTIVDKGAIVLISVHRCWIHWYALCRPFQSLANTSGNFVHSCSQGYAHRTCSDRRMSG
jgi:hypothetical protein